MLSAATARVNGSTPSTAFACCINADTDIFRDGNGHSCATRVTGVLYKPVRYATKRRIETRATRRASAAALPSAPLRGMGSSHRIGGRRRSATVVRNRGAARRGLRRSADCATIRPPCLRCGCRVRPRIYPGWPRGRPMSIALATTCRPLPRLDPMNRPQIPRLRPGAGLPATLLLVGILALAPGSLALAPGLPLSARDLCRVAPAGLARTPGPPPRLPGLGGPRLARVSADADGAGVLRPGRDAGLGVQLRRGGARVPRGVAARSLVRAVRLGRGAGARSEHQSRHDARRRARGVRGDRPRPDAGVEVRFPHPAAGRRARRPARAVAGSAAHTARPGVRGGGAHGGRRASRRRRSRSGWPPTPWPTCIRATTGAPTASPSRGPPSCRRGWTARSPRRRAIPARCTSRSTPGRTRRTSRRRSRPPTCCPGWRRARGTSSTCRRTCSSRSAATTTP